ncbi:E3 ubiquitin-protein ligase TRIM71-like [Oopsacas minuta]|uniref:E3 ubiquitin-protein ligase TRIM71-like n=1 Tax=Oopsacas minuta TaxID=111878 RepID=A0AAV7JLV9_9METZ|nr:E3 ubiquitin-protein ligase TRIM71-like [Oopsacas minuta]
MGNRSSKGSLRPLLIRTTNSPIRDYRIESNLHEDYVVLELSTSSIMQFSSKGFALHSLTSNTYVCDETNRCIRVFSSEFHCLFIFPVTKSLHHPFGICVANDRVYITEYYEYAISVFTLEGERITKCSFGYTNNPKTNIAFPSGITVDDEGNIYICDGFNHRIFILTHYDSGYCEFARSNLTQPRDIKLHKDTIIVLDVLHQHKSVYADIMGLKIFSQQEELLKEIELDLNSIQFFDVTPNSNYIICSSHYIKLISNNGEVLETFEKNIEISNTFHPGIVFDKKPMEIVGLCSSSGKPVSLFRFRIKDQ